MQNLFKWTDNSPAWRRNKRLLYFYFLQNSVCKSKLTYIYHDTFSTWLEIQKWHWLTKYKYIYTISNSLWNYKYFVKWKVLTEKRCAYVETPYLIEGGSGMWGLYGMTIKNICCWFGITLGFHTSSVTLRQFPKPSNSLFSLL